jgi:DNA replication protein DnaC
VVSLIDRFVRHSEDIAIEGDSYRMKEAHEQAVVRAKVKRGKTA